MSQSSNLYKRLKLVDEEELHRLVEKHIKEYNPELKAMADRKIEIAQIMEKKDLEPEETLALVEMNKQRYGKYQNTPYNPSPLGLMAKINTGEQTLQGAIQYPPSLANSTPTTEEAEITKSSQDSNIPPLGHAESIGSSNPPLPDVQNYNRNKLKYLAALIQGSDGAIGWDSKTGEIVLDGEKVQDSSFRDLIREMYVGHTGHSNLKGIGKFLQTISRLAGPGGKWENVGLKSIIPRLIYQKKLKKPYTSLASNVSAFSQKGEGKINKSKSDFPPGKKVKIMRLY